ncbi:hypothetical protein QBC32DRAFT_229051 [Pseudoneurospora amorphoporcata]|uniref:BHLH domain-containing protein n=1 Tax=Pseudoneurospora amorphoporcata TaxID=241081 RepID=A0AAN6SJB9_9PEZI|nr:hypothetical protein QBC32DRAFT_229051 [Pseudoneurospora amorphoporcata]
MGPSDSEHRQHYDDTQPSTHPSIPYTHPHDAYISGYASSNPQNLAHSGFSTPAVALQSHTDNYTVPSTSSAPVHQTQFSSYGVYPDHYIPHPLRSSSFSDRTSSVGLTLSTSALAVSDSIPIPPPSTYLLSSPASPLTAYSTDAVTISSFPYGTWSTYNQEHTAWPPYVADELQHESPTATGLPLQSLTGILKPVLGDDYNEEDRYIEQDITTTYATAYQRSQVTSPGLSGAVKKKEKLRKRRHRLAQTDDGQVAGSMFADAELMQSPLSSIMDFSAAASPGLITSRPSSLLWVQEDIAGSLINPKGKEKRQKKDSRTNKKKKQQRQPVHQQADKRIDGGKEASRRNSYASQTWETTVYDDDKDVVMGYTTTTPDNNSRRHSVTVHDLDRDATRHSVRPQQGIARVKHNKVEQKYRNRLNAHFEALLDVLTLSAALPTEQELEADTTKQLQPLGRSTDMVDLEIPEKERRVSKSEILDRARLYIQTLENEHKRLAAEKQHLSKMWDEYGNASREIR